jgi:plasmid stabilization system protein ParE
MAFRVEYSVRAKLDLDAILEWLLAQEAGDGGFQWFRKLQDAVYSLRELPQRCPPAPENKEFPFEVRQLLYGRRSHRYRILFTVEGETVVILHIRHGRRQHLGEPH